MTVGKNDNHNTDSKEIDEKNTLYSIFQAKKQKDFFKKCIRDFVYLKKSNKFEIIQSFEYFYFHVYMINTPIST